MNDAVVFSSPFKGEAGRGMGMAPMLGPHPHPSPPLEGEGASFMRLPCGLAEIKVRRGFSAMLCGAFRANLDQG